MSKERRLDANRPSPLEIDDEAPLRQDVVSEEISLVHPEMARLATTRERNAHLASCDKKAWLEHVCPNYKEWQCPSVSGQ